MLTIPWRTGVNLREFAYYNTRVVPHTVGDDQLQRNQLTKLKQMNVKLVRFYASANTCTTPECITQVQKALDLIAEFKMQAIVCLDDSLGSGFSVPGIGELPTDNGHYIKSFWVDKIYNRLYLPHIQALVGQFANHPGVLVWELGNEYALHPRDPNPTPSDIEAFFKFAQIASKTIKNLSPKRLVSTGLANSRQISYALQTEDAFKAFALRLYSIPTIDVICIHYYKGEGEKNNGQIDTDIAKSAQVNKPYYIGELGALFAGNDRPTFYREEIQEWKDAKAFSVLAWQFDNSQFDVGISDDKAMARRFGSIVFNDFDALCNVVQSFGADVAPFVVPTLIADGDSAPHIAAAPAPVPSSGGDNQLALLSTDEIRIRKTPTTEENNILGHANADVPLQAVDLAAAVTKVGQQNEWIRVRLEGWSAAWLLRPTTEGVLTNAEVINIRRDPMIQEGNILGQANPDTTLQAVDPAVAATKVGQQNEWIRVRLEGWSAAWLLRRTVEEPVPVPPIPPIFDTGVVPDLSDLQAGQRRAWDFDHKPIFGCLPVKNPALIQRFSGFGPNNFSYSSFRKDRIENGIEDGGYYKKLGGMHNGQDFVVPISSMLCSVDWGVVVHVSTGDDDNPFGAGDFSVIVRYGSYLALYGHMLSVEGMGVQEGQIVGPGTDIGLSGIGNDLPHLHFEVRNISAAHVTKLRQDAEESGAADVALHMSQAFNLAHWPGFVPEYVNPFPFFTPPLPAQTWPLAATLADVDHDHNGYPDQVIRAGQNAPVAYNLESIKSYPRGTQPHFWKGSREV